MNGGNNARERFLEGSFSGLGFLGRDIPAYASFPWHRNRTLNILINKLIIDITVKVISTLNES